MRDTMRHTQTSIHLDKKTRDRLRNLKVHPRESYNAVLERLIELRVDECPLSAETIRDIRRSLKDVRAGKFLTMSQIKIRLGMK